MHLEGSRSFPVLGALLVCALAVLTFPAPAGAEGDATEPRYPHLVWLEDPAHSATVVWTTEDEGDDHRVHWDLHSRDGQIDDYDHTVEAGRHVEEFGDNVYFHQATLDGLHPSATYHFVVETDGQTTREFYFRTAPADDRPIRLLYGGDSRSNPKSRRQVNRLLRRLHSSDDRVLGLVHGGDYVNLGMEWANWKSWLEDWMLTVSEDGQMLPVVPARGNHEFSIHTAQGKPDNYNGVWGTPGGPDKDYWTTRVGAQIAFVNLDSNATLGGDQKEWLDDQLATLTDNRRWILANYHRPAYPAVKEPGAAKVHWVPLFEKYRVDLVCESDGHVLKRTVPILDGEYDPNGIVYVGEGGLGVKQRTPRTDRWYLQSPGMTKSTHHVQRLTFEGDTLTYEALDLDGEVVDAKTFDKRRWGSPVELRLRDARLRDASTLEVEFSKGVTDESVSQTGHFEISPELSVESARRHPDFDNRAVLEVEGLERGVNYSIVANGIVDFLGNEIDPSTGNALFGLERPAATAEKTADAGSRDADSQDTGLDAAEPVASRPTGDTATCSFVDGPIGFGLFLVLVLGTVGLGRFLVLDDN